MIFEELKVILADGTILDRSSCGYPDDETLWVFVKGKTKEEAIELLSDPEKNQTITFIFGPKEYIYEGYTEFDTAIERVNSISVRLKKAII